MFLMKEMHYFASPHLVGKVLGTENTVHSKLANSRLLESQG